MAPSPWYLKGYSTCSFYPRDILPFDFAPQHSIVEARKRMQAYKHPQAKPQKSRGARANQIPINWLTLTELLHIQAAAHEVMAVLGLSDPSVMYNRCEILFGMPYLEWAASKKEGGRISIRRAMFSKAVDGYGDTAMLKHLSQHYLGMTEKVKLEASTEVTVNFIDAQNALSCKKGMTP